MNININKFDKICRTCLSEKANMQSIFEAYIADMLMACASVQILESDGLPKLICIQCLQQINRSYTFKQLCEKSDSSLRQCLREAKLNFEEQDEKPNYATEENNQSTDSEDTSEHRDSAEYHIKTEQLKLEISEHLKLDLKHVNADIWNKSNTDEDVNDNYNDVSNGSADHCEDNFQCNNCPKKFKGIASII